MALLDLQTGIELMEIVAEEVRRLHGRQQDSALTGGDHQALERLAKTFHVLQSEIREASKTFGAISDSDLAKLADDGDAGADSAG